MNRRQFIKRITGGVLAAALTNGACSTANSGNRSNGSDKPNIILIMADDLGYGDIGCYGSTKISTPNIDTLARGGMKFTDYHSNCPVCSPTRAALLTGRYQQRAGIEGVVTAAKHRHTGMALEEVIDTGLQPEERYLRRLTGREREGAVVDAPRQ